VWAANAAVLCASLSGSAGAQAGDPAAARALFAEARQLVAQKKYEQACPKFEESLRLDYGVGTLFNLADCLEHVGRTATAWARFLDATAGAKSAGQAERERAARERAAALEPKLSRLTIEVKSQDAGLEVKRDTQVVGRAAFGTAVPVDPGAHVVEATAPGKKAWSTRVQVPPNAATIAVTVPALEDDASAHIAKPPTAPSTDTPQAASAAASTGTPPPPSAAEQPSSGGLGTQKTVGLIVGGAGLVAVGVGTAFFLSYKSKNDEASGICPDSPMSCSSADIARHASLVDEATQARTNAFIGLGVGGAAVLAGTILFLTAPSSAATGVAAGPLVADGTLGGFVTGRF
jgi:hypothetical protein